MNDFIRTFIIDDGLFRGAITRNFNVIQDILNRKKYPQNVSLLLAEAITLTNLLASVIKYEGIFTLQIKGDAAIKTIVVDETSDGKIRAYARFDEQELNNVSYEDIKNRGSVPALLGAGYMIFTMDNSDGTQRYQGMVELEGNTLADCAHKYFQKSEQIKTAIKIAVAFSDTDKSWKSAGMLLQKMPENGGNKNILKSKEEIDDAWNTDVILMGSLTDQELLDEKLSPENILYRLYHEQDVFLFNEKILTFLCRCSRNRIIGVLKSFSEKDLQDMKKNNKISVTCEFCGKTYDITENDLKP